MGMVLVWTHLSSAIFNSHSIFNTDSGHIQRLNDLIDQVEPNVDDGSAVADESEEVFAWFSDEEAPEDIANADEW